MTPAPASGVGGPDEATSDRAAPRVVGQAARVTDQTSTSPSTSAAAALTAVGEARFVSLTTFRRTGEGVSTPVWVARDGDALLVLTPEESGKVKRLRNSPRVELRPCSRFGKVADGVEAVPATAEIVADPTTVDRLTGVVRRRYGLEFHVTMAVERLVARRQKPRVILRITSPAP